MSTLSDIFAPDTASDTQAASSPEPTASQDADTGAAGDDQVAPPPEPILPNDDLE